MKLIYCSFCRKKLNEKEVEHFNETGYDVCYEHWLYLQELGLQYTEATQNGSTP